MRYRLIKGGHPRDFITGKPVALGGLAERTVSTGYGGYYVLEKLLLEYWKKKRIMDITVAVQGFGKVGYWFAEIAAKQGMKVVAISNEFGGAYNPNGLDVEKTRAALGGNGGRGWCNVDGEEINNEKILELDVDVLVPAAIENVITEQNADRVKAKIVLELANGPTTNEADQILNDKGVWVALGRAQARAGRARRRTPPRKDGKAQRRPAVHQRRWLLLHLRWQDPLW